MTNNLYSIEVQKRIELEQTYRQLRAENEMLRLRVELLEDRLKKAKTASDADAVLINPHDAGLA